MRRCSFGVSARIIYLAHVFTYWADSSASSSERVKPLTFTKEEGEGCALSRRADSPIGSGPVDFPCKASLPLKDQIPYAPREDLCETQAGLTIGGARFVRRSACRPVFFSCLGQQVQKPACCSFSQSVSK